MNNLKLHIGASAIDDLAKNGWIPKETPVAFQQCVMAALSQVAAPPCERLTLLVTPWGATQDPRVGRVNNSLEFIPVDWREPVVVNGQPYPTKLHYVFEQLQTFFNQNLHQYGVGIMLHLLQEQSNGKAESIGFMGMHGVVTI